MAVPTAPSTCFAESTAPTTAVVYWTDNSSDEIGFKIERSLTSGSGFAEVGQAGVSETVFVDSGLTSATRYFYRVKAYNADGSSAASNEGSVVTQTCDGVAWPGNDLQLPRSPNDPILVPNAVNDMASRLEQWASQSTGEAGTCDGCPVNGAVVLDLSKCCNYSVTMTEDINSISIINSDRCENGVIDFVVPAGSSFNISGFPDGFGFDAQVGRTNLNNTGNVARTYRLPFRTSRPSGAGSGNRPRSTDRSQPVASGLPGGGGGGGGGTACGPVEETDLAVTTKTATGGANSLASMDCVGAKSMLLVASGGCPPYTWSTTKGTLSATVGSQVTLTPPTNTGSGVAGTAYEECGCGINPPFCTIPPAAALCFAHQFGCDDLEESACVTAASPCFGTEPPHHCCTGAACPNQAPPNCGLPACGSCAQTALEGIVTDMRTQVMIDAGCNPCGISMDGAVVTATDSQSVSVATSISP